MPSGTAGAQEGVQNEGLDLEGGGSLGGVRCSANWGG